MHHALRALCIAVIVLPGWLQAQSPASVVVQTAFLVLLGEAKEEQWVLLDLEHGLVAEPDGVGVILPTLDTEADVVRFAVPDEVNPLDITLMLAAQGNGPEQYVAHLRMRDTGREAHFPAFAMQRLDEAFFRDDRAGQREGKVLLRPASQASDTAGCEREIQPGRRLGVVQWLGEGAGWVEKDLTQQGDVMVLRERSRSVDSADPQYEVHYALAGNPGVRFAVVLPDPDLAALGWADSEGMLVRMASCEVQVGGDHQPSGLYSAWREGLSR